jgi:hypothetical protein
MRTEEGPQLPRSVDPAGDIQNQLFQYSFHPSLNVDFPGSRVAFDGGLILVRELDEQLGSGELITQHLTDSRRGKNTQLPLADQFRQSVYSRIAGYEDVNDAERLAQDPTLRLIGSEKIGTWSLTSLQQRLVKTGGRLIKHARYYWLLLAESHLTWRLFGSMLRRMEALPPPAGSARRESETSLDGRGELTGEVFEQVLRNGGNLGFFVPEAAQPGTPGALGWKRMQKIASGGKWRYIGSQPKGKTEIPAQIESFEIRWKSPICASLNAAAVLLLSHLPRQGIRQRVPLFHSPDCGYQTHPITALH